MNTEAYKGAVIASAEKEANTFLKTGKISGEFAEAVEAFVDNEGAYTIIAMILNDAPKGDVIAKVHEYAFSDCRMAREVERNESIAYQNHADMCRYEARVGA